MPPSNPTHNSRNKSRVDPSAKNNNIDMVDTYLDWMAQGLPTLSNSLHKIPKHIEKLLSKFDPDKKTNVEDHIDEFYMHLRMLEVHFDNVICRIFQYTLEGRASVWYNSLPGQFNQKLEGV